MMKKIFLLVTFFVLGKMWSYAQYPITQNIGSDSTIVVSKGALQSRLINVTYPDTATANLQRIRQYPGAQIATTSGGINLWVRNTTATAWLPINTGSGNNIYTIDGTLTGNRTLTGNNYSLTFTGLSQFLLTVGNQTFTVRSDSASLTRKLSYASNRGSTFTLYSLVDKNYVDSAIASSPAGTVTQINTNNNTGITGGPITSTGTLAIDTLLISTRAWRQKGVDSLQANINLKLNIVDTTGMLANYVNSVGYGLGKTSQTVYVDSASLSNYYLRRKDSLTATNPLGYVTQKILADTAAAIRSSDLGGTVTSVATNNGTGITGGTITTSGTLAIDTTIISTRAWRQKGVDSLQANINLKLNISDTASMLNPYLRKVDTASLSNRINQKLNISDTASMLSPYLRSNTAAATYVPQTRTLTINGTTQDLSANRTYNVGTVTSVGLTMPAAFNVANSPVTGSGTLAVTGAGLASQYIRGDGTLANFPGGGGGGGASVSYYLNGSVNQGTFGGNTYYQMNKTPVLGAGTNFTINANGYIAQFITNAGDPALLNIPAGNWNFELFFSASSGGGTPSYYVELYKYDGTTFTLIASGSSNPDVIVNSAVDAYFSALPVPQTTLTLTDRLAVRIYVTHAGRTITLHTEDNNLCQVVTTFTTGITAINSLTAQVQYLTTGTSGTDFNISSLTDTHTFNLPVASGTNTGKLSNTDWTTFNNKVGGSLVNGYITKATGTNTIDTSQLFQSNGLIGIGTTSPTQKLQVSGNAYVNGQLFAGDTALSVYQVEGILNTPYVLGRKAVNNTLSTEARPTGVMGHVVGRGSIANRLQGGTFYATTDSASTANSTGSLRGITSWSSHNGSGSLTTAWGGYNIVQNKTTGTITNAYGSVSGVENRGATSTINKLHGTTTEIWNNYGGTIDTAFGQVISIYNNNAASNIGAVYGLSIGKGLITPTGGTHYWRNSGTIGTSYGLYLDSSIDVGTTKYALFSNSNSNSYFRAKLGVGTTSPDSAFQVATGAYFQRGIRASGLPQAAGTKALRIDASGTISYADTLIDAGGTVTSVATNNGTGITGGTITTSGTLAIDTLLISTRAWRQKGVDSVAALANTKVSGSLISGYIPKATGTLTVDTSQIYQNNGNIGIGTISPASGFKVDMTGSLRVGNGSSYNNITINGNSGAGSYLRFQKNGTNKGDIGPYSAVLGGTPPYSGSNDDLTYSSVGGHFFNTNAGIKMYLNNAGNLGLSASPDSMLTVLEGAYFQRGVRMSGLPSAPGTRALRINANGTLSVADTLVDAGGTVTSVATNNGTGITGGTITTTGTLAIDTLRISTRAWRQKGIDSVQANLTAGLATKLNISDTASMLSPYLRSNVAAATYVPQTRTITINGTSQDLSANRTYNVGTVTSVATNTGTGITGGTITSSGTIAADTLLLSTRAWRQKGIDSVAALINSNVSGTTNYVAKFTGTNTIGNSQLFDNGTNVGIGTTSPTVKLDVNGTIASNNGSLGLFSSGTSTRLVLQSNGVNKLDANSTQTEITDQLGATVLTLKSGNAGIGTTSPQSILHTNVSSGSIFNQITSGVNQTYIGFDAVTGLSNFQSNTGIWFSTGGSYTERMRITSGGNLLVGTTTDGGYKLDVSGIGRFTSYVSFNDKGYIRGGTNTLDLQGGTTGTYIYNSSYNTVRMAILDGGNVGIGTTSPSNKLDVIGRIISSASGNQALLGASDIQSGGATVYLNSAFAGAGTPTVQVETNHPLLFATNNTERMRLDASGNLGIGLSSSLRGKLDVGGFAVVGNGASGVSTEAIRFSRSGDDFRYQSIFTTSGGSAAANLMQFNLHNFSTATSQTTVMTLNGAGAVRFNAYGSGSFTGTRAYDLSVDASGNIIEVPIGAGTITGSGTTNYIPKFTSSSAIGNSIIQEDGGGNLGINGSAPSFSTYRYLKLYGAATTTGGVFQTSTSDNSIIGNFYVDNTGGVLGLATNNDLRFLTNSAERMRLTSGGNLGIGTTSPNVAGVDVGLTINGGSNSILEVNYGGTRGGFLFANSSNVVLSSVQNLPLLFNTANIERMRLDASGNLGVGTTIPQAPLDVLGRFTVRQNDGSADVRISGVGNRDAFLYFYEGSTQRGYVASVAGSNNLLFGTGTTERMRLDASGNLGLGVTPNTWGGTGVKAFQFQNGSLAASLSFGALFGWNTYYDGSYRYVSNSSASAFLAAGNDFIWYQAPSGTAGNAISFTQAMTLDASGNFMVGGTSSNNVRAHISGLGATTGTGTGSSNIVMLLTDTNSGAQNVGAGIGFAGNDGVNTGVTFATINGRKENSTMGNYASYLSFQTRQDGNALTERMRITSGGNLLLATTTDNGARLNINGYAAVSNNNAWCGVPTTGGFTALIGLDNNNKTQLGTTTNGSVMTLTGNNVGIGTTSPAKPLHIYSGDANGNIYLTRASSSEYMNIAPYYTVVNGNDYLINVSSSNNLRLFTNDTERMRITSGGNVGIGTTSPTEKLEVAANWGNLRLYGRSGIRLNNLSSNLYYNGSSWVRDNSSYGATSITFTTTGDILFENSSASSGDATEKMRITSGGNVGIGTSSPTQKLDVVGTSQSTATYIPYKSITTSNTLYNEYYVNTSTLAGFVGNGNGILSGGGDINFGIRAEGALLFAAGGNSEKMRITSGGNVLVGSTTDGGFKLYVNGTTKSQSTLYLGGNTDMIDPSSNSGFMTIGSNQPIRFTNASTTEYMRITTSGIVGIGTSSPDASVKLQVESSSSSSVRIVSSAASGGDLYITSVNGGSESRIDKQGTAGPLTFYNNGSERMRLTSGGELLINTTTDAGAYPLQVNGSVYATAYYESSDLRLKNVLSERQGSDGINTITFKWKDGRDSLTHIGYAAQQVEKVLPDAVKTNTDGYKTINYDEVQSLKIANLEQEIAELKKIIKQLIDKK